MQLTTNDGAVITVHNVHDPRASDGDYGWVIDCSHRCMIGGGGTKADAEADAHYHFDFHNGD